MAQLYLTISYRHFDLPIAMIIPGAELQDFIGEKWVRGQYDPNF